MNRRKMMEVSAGATGAALMLGCRGAQRESKEAASQEPVVATPDKFLLKDFEPHSIFKIPQTHIEKAKYPVIDSHGGGAGDNADPQRLDEAVKVMDSLGVQKSVVSGLWLSTPEELAPVAKLYSKYPERFNVRCVFDFRGVNEPGFVPKALKSLDECHRLGAIGIGEILDKGKGLEVMFNAPATLRSMQLPEDFVGAPHLDDARMDPLLDRCGQLGMPISVHVADPIWAYQQMDTTNDEFKVIYPWRQEPKPGDLGYDELMGTLERAAKKHPKTTFIALHYASMEHDLGRLGKMLDRNPNLYVDTSSRVTEIASIPLFASEFFRKYQDRILYGTDSGFYDPEWIRTSFRVLETLDEHFYGNPKFIWPMYGLGLPDPILKKVYHENALRVFRPAHSNA